MKILIALIFYLLISSNSFAAFTASAVMELRATGGSALNSGVFDSGVVSPGTDYTQQDSSQFNGTDLASSNGTNAACVVTSAGHNFVSTDNGNTITISAGTSWTVSVFVIVSTAGNAATLDKACGSVDALSSGTWREGGSFPMGNATAGISDDARFELLIGGNTVWVKNGSYSPTNISIASVSGTITSPIHLYGYNTAHGDNPTGTNRPTWNLAGNSFSNSASVYIIKNLQANGTASSFFTLATSSEGINLKIINTSSTASRTALILGQGAFLFNSEVVSQNGNAIGVSNQSQLIGDYIHDSDVCIAGTTATLDTIGFNIVENCKTAAYNSTAIGTRSTIFNNTFYGSEAKLGLGVSYTGTGGATINFFNNIFYGFSTALANGASQDLFIEDYNDFYNNTADRSSVSTGSNSIALNPQFVGASQITGTLGTAAPSGTTLTDSGADFSTVTDNIDFLRITSGSGSGTATVTAGNYLITGHTTTTLTLNNAIMSAGTGTGSSIVYSAAVGHNFSMGANLKSKAFPGAFNSNSSESTGYLDIGAIQRQESTGFFIQ